jgi:hypothetical protein
LDFTGITEITACGSETLWPLVAPDSSTGTDGITTFSVNAGGCTVDSVPVMSSHGIIAKVPIKSLDNTGGLLVKADDFVWDECNDYNLDGVIDQADWQFFEDYIGLSCPDNAADQLMLEVYTNPGPHDIFEMDTIEVCGKIINNSGGSMILDSVLFETAHWGIAHAWSQFASHYNVYLEGNASITLCEDFIVPQSHHGCFRITAFPRYAETQMANDDIITRQRLDSPLPGSFRAIGETASEIVRILRQLHNIDINFIQADFESPLYFYLTEGTYTDILNEIAANDPAYTAEIIDERIVLRPTAPIFESIVKNSQVDPTPRLEATNQYLETVREQIPQLSNLLSPVGFGDLDGPMFMDMVSLDQKSRLVDHLVQLLGGDTLLSFSITKVQSELPMLAFHRTYLPTSSFIGCEDCRPIDVPIANPNVIPCQDGACGKWLLVDYPGITTDCCEGETDCDCAGGRLTEKITTSGTCLVPSVQTGEGCEILSGGELDEACNHDNFGLCYDVGNFPSQSCTWKITQKLYICDRLIQTVTIDFKINIDGENCSADNPKRVAGTPIPPPSCGSTPSKGRQLNVDARKRPQENPIEYSIAGLGPSEITSFEIPIGTEYGDSLLLYRFAFIPDGWSYTVSDSNWIYTPDTIHVEITHDDVIAEEDTARVVFYAFSPEDEFAGSAEVMVYDPGPMVSVAQVPDAGLPQTFELTQNFPNPFNPMTNIEFALPEASDVTVEVVNILGQRVAELIDNRLPAGTYRVEWNGKDFAGKPVATGIYFYRIKAGDFIETKKMLLLK